MDVDTTDLEETDRAAFDRWRARRDREGVRVDVVDLYEEVAGARGIAPDDLALEHRKVLAQLAMQVIWPGFEKVGSTRPSRPIELVAPQPDWPSQFASWRDRLRSALGATAIRISHIGSTSVPGLEAKPIIDLLATVKDLDDEDRYVPGCEGLGLELWTRDDEHRFFVDGGATRHIEVHLHVCRADSAFERDHLLFRDYLATHDDERDVYATVKHEAASRWREDRMAYTYTKSDVILTLLEHAEAWAAETGWRVETSP